MANIIAVIWDCDKTLVDGYMQDPIFKDYKIESSDFGKSKCTAIRTCRTGNSGKPGYILPELLYSVCA